MNHMLTHYRDIVWDDEAEEWITVPGKECIACGELWPCSEAVRHPGCARVVAMRLYPLPFDLHLET